MWESLFDKIAGLQVCRPETLLKRDSITGVFLWKLRNSEEHLFWETSTNEWFCIKVRYLRSTTVMSHVFLYWKYIVSFFFCYIVIFFVNNKQNILFNLNPCVTKRQHMWKKSFDIFLLYLHNRFFLVLEVLYERSFTKHSQNFWKIRCRFWGEMRFSDNICVSIVN